MAHVSRFQHPLAEPLEQGISVVVPAYNSETSLPELAARLEAVLKTQTGPYELILVNDGSRDRTWAVIQALAARHRISLNGIGEPVHITTGRRLTVEQPADGASVLVLLDGQCAFKTLAGDDIDIYWGAYLGTPDEILLSGRLSELSGRIEQLRTRARNQKGWIMDTYLLRRRGASSC